jgi:hypothetical protein
VASKVDNLSDSETAWVEGFVTGLAEVREIVDELLVRADSCIRGGKANSYLRELIKRWPIPDPTPDEVKK